MWYNIIKRKGEIIIVEVIDYKLVRLTIEESGNTYFLDYNNSVLNEYGLENKVETLYKKYGTDMDKFFDKLAEWNIIPVSIDDLIIYRKDEDYF